MAEWLDLCFWKLSKLFESLNCGNTVGPDNLFTEGNLACDNVPDGRELTAVVVHGYDR